VLARKSIENRVWFKSGAMIEALGWEQELQSFKQHAHRPDRAYLDDPENLERVRDTAAVDASMRKLWLELVPAMDKRRRKIRITQTRRAEDCMVTRLAANPEWLYRAYPVCDRDPDDPAAKSNWPDKYPMEWIRAEKKKYQAAGMLREFLQSYMLQTTDASAKSFKDEMLAFMDVSPWHWMPRFAIYDPARTSHDKRTKGHGEERPLRQGRGVAPGLEDPGARELGQPLAAERDDRGPLRDQRRARAGEDRDRENLARRLAHAADPPGDPAPRDAAPARRDERAAGPLEGGFHPRPAALRGGPRHRARGRAQPAPAAHRRVAELPAGARATS
jgi:hypothetical protein